MTKPSILFVDDEPNILQGLKRFTRRKRDQWDLLFAQGGEEALRIAQTRQIDVMIVDMRMPGLDGADLLRCVSNDLPSTIFLILSGEADVAQTYRTIGFSHQFIAKPCDPESLLAKIEQLLFWKMKVGPELLSTNRPIFNRMPCQAATLAQLQNEFDHGDGKLSTAAAIIAGDPHLAARILQLANSAYFGRPIKTFGVERAAESLGLERIRDLLSKGVFGDVSADENDPQAATAEILKPHILAMLARDNVAAEEGSKTEQELAFALGLFCTLGRPLPEEAEAVGSANLLVCPSAVFVTALLGMPAELVNGLAALLPEHRETMTIDNWAYNICRTVMDNDCQAA